jgi:hypothetical protein
MDRCNGGSLNPMVWWDQRDQRKWRWASQLKLIYGERCKVISIYFFKTLTPGYWDSYSCVLIGTSIWLVFEKKKETMKISEVFSWLQNDEMGSEH